MSVNATFEQIELLINNKNFTSSGFSKNLQNFASEGNHIFVIVDKLGNTFIAEVYYNPETKGIQPPLAQQILHLINLPLPILIDVAVGMRLPDILSMCRTSRYLNQVICESDDFWKKKFIHDFGMEEITTEEKGPVPTPNYWKRRYQNFRKVYSFGNNYSGQLGLGPGEVGVNVPTEILGIAAKAISTGYTHSLISDINGKVYSFGKNLFGELGLIPVVGMDLDVNKPTEIIGLTGIKDVSAGVGHSMILNVDGTVYSFGANGSGQLGFGDNTIRTVPTSMIRYIKAISSGGTHSLTLGIDGKIYSFGGNQFGQLGLGTNVDVYIPTEIPRIIGKDVSAGMSHSMILGIDGKVYSFGSNEFGQLGLGDNLNRNIPTEIPGIVAKAISAGFTHSLILGIDGKVYSFGDNIRGQLGLGDNVNRNIPIGIPGIIAKAISAGWMHSLMINSDGKIYSFGSNYRGQLGLGDNVNRNVPTLISDTKVRAISAGSYYSLVIT